MKLSFSIALLIAHFSYQLALGAEIPDSLLATIEGAPADTKYAALTIKPERQILTPANLAFKAHLLCHNGVNTRYVPVLVRLLGPLPLSSMNIIGPRHETANGIGATGLVYEPPLNAYVLRLPITIVQTPFKLIHLESENVVISSEAKQTSIMNKFLELVAQSKN